MATKEVSFKEGTIRAKDSEVIIHYNDDEEPEDQFYGAHPSVISGEFDPSRYPIPTPQGSTIRLEDFGGRVGIDVATGKANSIALGEAAKALRNGGILDVSSGVYGVFGSTRMEHMRGATIMGSGWRSGFAAVDQPFSGSRWRCLIEIRHSEEVVFNNFAVDIRDQPIGGLYHLDDRKDLWFVNLHISNIGGSADAEGKPLAAIKASDDTAGFNMVGCLVEKGVGDAGPGSGVRGYWSDDQKNVLIEHCVFRDMGHTACAVGAVDNCVIRHVTSERNAGGGMKTVAPRSQWSNGTWVPGQTVMTVERCLLVDNGKGHIPWGIQMESPGIKFSGNKLSGNGSGIATFTGFREVEITQNLIVENEDAGVWISGPKEGTPLYGPFDIHHNTIRGKLSKAGIAMHPHVDRPNGNCLIRENNIPAGKTAVDIQPAFTAHDGYQDVNNGPDGEGASPR